MTTQQEIVCRSLLEFVAKVKEGSGGWITFTANGDEHWLQYSHGEINMDWPFTVAPDLEKLTAIFGSMAPLTVVDWNSDQYAMFRMSNPAPELLVPAIDQVFRELYSLGDDYRLKFKVEDD